VIRWWLCKLRLDSVDVGHESSFVKSGTREAVIALQG
jgi:hypothetical protein